MCCSRPTGCASAPSCAPSPEVGVVLCTNGIDDDRDGLFDCNDTGCDGVAACVRGSSCGAVPTTGRCASSTQIEFCQVAAGGGDGVVTLDCAAGETCAATAEGASCVFTGVCREGEIQCLDATRVRACVGGAWSGSTCPRACISTVIGDTCAPDVATRGTSGVLRYDVRGPNAGRTDWGASIPVVGQGFLMLSVRIPAVGDIQLFDAFVTTEGDESTGGRFSLRVPTLPTANDFLLVAAVRANLDGSYAYAVANPGYAASTLAREVGGAYPDPQLWVWSRPISGRIDGDEFRITEAMGSGAARVFDYVRYVHNTTVGYFGAAPALAVWVGLGTTWSCGACASPSPTFFAGSYFDSQIWIAGGSSQGYWADAVTAHELGHFAMSAFGRSPGEAGVHYFGGSVHPGMAWSEGWATFFSSDMRDSPVYFDKQGGGAVWFDISARAYSAAVWTRPTATAGLNQRIDENEVSSMLWATSATVSRDGLWSALASPRMTIGPFERGYTRRYWEGDPAGAVDTGVNSLHLADYFDQLICSGSITAPSLDLITEPSVRYPYPSRSPLCR